MRAGGFAAGTALIGTREIPVGDQFTEQAIAKFRRRLHNGTDATVLEAAAALERPQASRHPLCAELRAIVTAELDARHLSLAPLAGGAK